MAEPAAASAASTALPTSSGVNPNVEVGDEKVLNKGGASEATFEDFERMHDEADKDKRAKAATKKKDAKAAKDADAEPKEPAEKGGDGKTPKEPKDDKPEKVAADKTEPKPKGIKVHKLKIGDAESDLPGDATMTIPVDGKMVAVPVQELVNDYNGRTEHSKHIAAAKAERKEIETTRTNLNTMAKNLYEKASADPEAGFDFLAELTKQDPVALKEKILRENLKQYAPLFAMDEVTREAAIKDYVRDWRDKAHDARGKADAAAQAEAAAKAERTESMKAYGIDDDRYGELEKIVHDHLKKVDKDFDGKVTKDQIIFADRRLMAVEVIEDVMPSLVNHAQYATILEDITSDLLRHPDLDREKLGKSLLTVFGKDDKALREVGRREQRSATVSRSAEPADRRPSQSKAEPVFFEDL